jgi:hypothetical protein
VKTEHGLDNEAPVLPKGPETDRPVLTTASHLDSTRFVKCPRTRRTRRRSVRGHSARALRSLLIGGGSIGFDRKIALALALRVITSRTRDRLQILNTLRNKCSHNWVLKVPTRYGKRPAQKKPPLLLYEGRDLHSVPVLKDFVSEYGGGIYLKLFMKYLDLA